MPTSYLQTGGFVADGDPRVISNLIADQTAGNAAALEAQAGSTPGTGYLYHSSSFVPNPDYNPALPEDFSNLQFLPNNVALTQPVDASGNLFIPNVTPDAGLSAPYNSWFTFFGQFFDHGLDLVSKGGNGYVLIPLAADDPLITLGPDGIAASGDELTNPAQQFMVVTRASIVGQHAGADGVLGTADDVRDAENTTTPFVDQNQTYSSHPAHQVFLREYCDGCRWPRSSTGRLLTGADGAEHGDVGRRQGQCAEDRHRAEQHQRSRQHPAGQGRRLRQLHRRPGHGSGPARHRSRTRRPVWHGRRRHDLGRHAGRSITTAGALRIGHAFLNDIAHTANPVNAQTGAFMPPTPTPISAMPRRPARFDNELLDAHYIAGDGRANENIGLTAVHDIFHAEHNRLIEQTKAFVQAELAKGDTSFALDWVLPGAEPAPTASRPTSGTASACSRSPSSAPRRSTSTSCSRSSRARCRRTSTCSATTTSISIPRSPRSSRTRSIASATRC